MAEPIKLKRLVIKDTADKGVIILFDERDRFLLTKEFDTITCLTLSDTETKKLIKVLTNTLTK